MQTGIIIVDHGSRREESNQMLEELTSHFARRFKDRYDIIEPAHMELAEPSIASAYAKCVERGASRVVVVPFFSGSGEALDAGHPAFDRRRGHAVPGDNLPCEPDTGNRRFDS